MVDRDELNDSLDRRAGWIDKFMRISGALKPNAYFVLTYARF